VGTSRRACRIRKLGADPERLIAIAVFLVVFAAELALVWNTLETSLTFIPMLVVAGVASGVARYVTRPRDPEGVIGPSSEAEGHGKRTGPGRPLTMVEKLAARREHRITKA
jgi:hypothetical protein